MSAETTGLREPHTTLGARTIRESFSRFAADIKLAHSVFALPFAASALLLAPLPWPTLRQAALLLLCMVTARSFAMGMNRVLDRKVDAENPRTRGRMIPKGGLTVRQGLFWSLGSGAVFIAAATALSPLAGWCAAPLLAILGLYPMMKHWSWLTHWYLGLCLGLAPVAVAVALTGAAPTTLLLLGAAVALWTGGFDILYALQDLHFDRERGLHSIPSRFGPAAALWISRASFVLMVSLLIACGILANRHALYFCGVAAVTGILVTEQVLVRDAKRDGHSRHINLAFFNLNASVSVIFFAAAVLDGLVFNA